MLTNGHSHSLTALINSEMSPILNSVIIELFYPIVLLHKLLQHLLQKLEHLISCILYSKLSKMHHLFKFLKTPKKYTENVTYDEKNQ